jgi:hypothetical protein
MLDHRESKSAAAAKLATATFRARPCVLAVGAAISASRFISAFATTATAVIAIAAGTATAAGFAAACP